MLGWTQSQGSVAPQAACIEQCVGTRPNMLRAWACLGALHRLTGHEDLARRAALALDNARLYERQRMTSQALQHSLLPPELPEIPSNELRNPGVFSRASST